jgi:hypothetical protein
MFTWPAEKGEQHQLHCLHERCLTTAGNHPSVEKVPTDALIILLHERLCDYGAHIASLSDILGEPELHHQLVQDSGAGRHRHVLVGGDLGKSVSRYRRDNEVIW